MPKKPFKETKVGKFLNEKASPVLDSVLEMVGDAYPPAKLITGAVQSLLPDMPEEDKKELESLLPEYEAVDYKDYLADVQNARAREIAVNESEHASWLVKNTAPMIALAFVIFTIVLFILVLIREVKTTENITFLVIGSITSITTTIIGYYFGSSRASAQKDETIRKLSSH